MLAFRGFPILTSNKVGKINIAFNTNLTIYFISVVFFYNSSPYICVTKLNKMKKYTILMNGHPFQTNEFNCKKDALKRISKLQKWFKYSSFSLIFNK